jgi:hypothetical protein
MSEIEIPFEFRMKAAQRYHDFRNLSEDKSWYQLFDLLDTNQDLGIPEALVLLDPKYYQQIGVNDPRGDRLFPPAEPGARCRSLEIWGYKCPYVGGKIHIDHVFPQSKGGLTHPQNAMHLCREHNMSKHTDIHMIPWEKMIKGNEWIKLAFTKFIQSAQRTSGQRLYMPHKQISKI